MRWLDVSRDNSDRPAFQHDVGLGYPIDAYPGVTVAYGKGHRGQWRVVVEMLGAGHRRSADMLSESSARAAADALVDAMYLLWPQTGGTQP